MAMGFANIWVPVEDVDRAASFYEDTLGLSQVKKDGNWVEYETDGVRIGLNGREPGGAGADGRSSSSPSSRKITWSPAMEDLQGKGVEFPAGVSEHDWGRVATFKDSEGNELQLYEPPQS